MKRVPLLVLGFAFSVASLQAGQVSFDFESQSPTYFGVGLPTGALSSLAVTSGGLTLTVTRFGGIHFDLVSNTGAEAGKPVGWGNVSLDPFVRTNSFWILDFSQPITSFSVQSGDYGGDSDTEMITLLSGPGGTGNLVGIVSPFYGTQAFPAISSAFIVTPGASSVEIMDPTSVGGVNDSVYLDNIVVTVPTPEPGGLLLAIGSLSLLFVYRRKRRS